MTETKIVTKPNQAEAKPKTKGKNNGIDGVSVLRIRRDLKDIGLKYSNSNRRK